MQQITTNKTTKVEQFFNGMLQMKEYLEALYRVRRLLEAEARKMKNLDKEIAEIKQLDSSPEGCGRVLYFEMTMVRLKTTCDFLHEINNKNIVICKNTEKH